MKEKHTEHSDPLPPSHIEAEMAVLGSILNPEWSQEAFTKAHQVLVPSDFYNTAHQTIYQAMTSLVKRGEPIDVVTLSEELKKAGRLDETGGRYYLTQLAESVPSAANLEAYLRSVLETSKRREVIRITHAAHDPRIPLDEIKRRLDTLHERSVGPSHRSPSIKQILDELEDHQEEQWWVEDIIPKASLVMIAAPAGSYKTTLALGLTAHIGSGSPFAGKDVQQGNVCYVDKENARSVLAHRLPLLFSGDETVDFWPVYREPTPPLLTDRHINQYVQIAREYDVMIFDSLRRYHRNEENSSTEMERIMAHLLKLRDCGCTVIFVHHSGKNDDQQYRGSEEILAATDLAYSLKRNEDLITLKSIKNRFGCEGSITLRIHWEDRITFESALDPGLQKTEEELAIIRKIIQDYHDHMRRWPNQSLIVDKGTEQGLGKNRIPVLLEKGVKKGYWEQEKGPNNAKLYVIPVSRFPGTIERGETGKPKQEALFTTEEQETRQPDRPWHSVLTEEEPIDLREGS
jgi:hypothetical protein